MDKEKKMKKYISIILSCLIIAVLGYFIFSNNKEQQALDQKKEDKNVNISNIPEEFKGKNIIVSTSISDKVLQEDFKVMVNHSDSVVKGTVNKLNYETIDGNAWTKMEFKVEEDYKGNLKPEDIIYVYYMGGYIKLKEHIEFYDDAFRFESVSQNDISNTVIKEIVDGETDFIKKGESLVLCLVKARSVFPKGSYERIDVSGMLKQDGNSYIQKYGEVEDKYSIKANELTNIKKIAAK